jgi:peptide/nickel transport system permease protein
MRRAEGPLALAWRRFARSRFAKWTLIYVVALLVVAAAAPLIANRKPLAAKTADGWRFPAFADYVAVDADIDPPHDAFINRIDPIIPFSPNTIDLTGRLLPPSARHWLGTDELGRDVLSRMIHGSRVSLTVGIMATLISLVVGSFLGALAGFYGHAVDWLVSRVIEVVLCFPFLFLVLGIVALFKPSMQMIMLALGLTTWTNEARYIRGEILRIREIEYAQAARASGARDARIILRHLLPNALAPVIVSSSFAVAWAILIESSLSFLGLGVAIPTASWGSILGGAYEHIEYAWWLVLFPGLAIFSTVAAFNVIGDGFRDALDPRS